MFLRNSLSGLALLALLSGCGGGGTGGDDTSSDTPDTAPVTWNVWDYLAKDQAGVVANDPNLQVYFTFEEGTGTVTADQSDYGYNATIIPFDGSYGTLWRGGHNGNGLVFSERGRATVEQDLSLDAALTGQQLAISCWVKLSDTTVAGNVRLVSKKEVDFQHEGFELEMNPSIRRIRFIGQSEEYIDAYIPVEKMDDQWHHVMFNLDAGVGSVRLDGVDITDSSANTLVNPDILQSVSPLSIGALSDNSSPSVASFPGTMDDVRVYNRALSVTEQVQLFTDELSQRGLIAWWKLDETTGNTFVDSSGFGHDATGSDVTAGASGHIDAAANFYTPDSRLNAGGGFSLALTSQMSCSAWVRVEDTELNYYMRIVSKKELDADLAGFEFAYYPEENKLVFNGGGGKAAYATVALDSNWHHVAAAVNGTTVQLYVDGQPVTTGGNIDTPLQSSRPVYLGHRATDDATWPGTWQGDLDDIRIYAHELSDAEVLAIYNEASNNAPEVAIANPLNDISVIKGATVELLGTATDTEDGNIAASATWTSSLDGDLGTGSFVSTTNLSYGRHVITFSVSDSDGDSASASVDVVVQSDPAALVRPSIGDVNASSSWQTVTLPVTYTSPIVICTPNYDDTKTPMVARVRNALGNSFEVKVQAPSGAALSNVPVHYFVIEEGVYNLADHGIALEALQYTSTRTDHDQSWVGEAIDAANVYSSPVVLGQVASENDAAWSVFWSRGTSYTNPVSNAAIYIGKHVAEDPNTTRADETLHYVVAEAGSGSFEGISYHVGIGGDFVAGVDNSPPYVYTVNNVASASVGILSSTGIDGVNGGWPILYGASPVSATQVNIAYDEDQLQDSERSHTSEQVAFFVLADPGAPTLSLATPTPNSIHLEDDVINFSASANDLEDGDLSASINWSSNIDGALGSGANISTDLLSPGFHVITASVADSDAKSASDSVEIVVMSLDGPSMETGVLANVGSTWQTVNLPRTFSDMAVFCAVSYDDSVLPAVARVRNATGSSFEVMVQNPSGTALTGYTVHYQVFETGVYQDAVHGLTMEIIKFESDKTDNSSNWSGSQRNYYNTYTNPVVVGQVMTANDARWTSFWSRGSSQGNPASASDLYVGKTVCEDSDRERVAETIAYLVIEAGSGYMDGVDYTAGVGADSIRGLGDSPSYDYSLSGLPSAQSAMVSISGIDGGNGGWPVLYGATPLDATTLRLAIDEDQIGDSERSHTSEQVNYLVFSDYPVTKLDN
jgi:hypothetical protein